MKKFMRGLIIFFVIVVFMNIFHISVFVGNTKIDRYFVVEQFEKLNGKDIADTARDIGSGVKNKVDKVVENTK